MAMSIISVRVNDEEKAVLEDAARFYKCSMSSMIKRLTFEKLEDEYDMKVAEEYVRRRDNGTAKTRPIQDLCKEVGIDWDSL